MGDFVEESKKHQVSSHTGQVSNSLGSGIQEKLKSAGIDVVSLTKGLLVTLAPLILAKVMGRRLGTSSGLGGALGSLIPGLGAGAGSRAKGGLLGNILSQLGR